MPADPDHSASDAGRAALTDTVYSHLRAIAQHQMAAERPGHSLSATALVHEAYLRLGDQGANRRAFVFAASEAMRHILIERARARGRIKRGGGRVRLSLDAIGDVADLDGVDEPESVFAFDEAFRRLQEHEPPVADVVRLRFFAGLSVAETAQALDVSERTVNNYWSYARAWMARTMREGTPSPQSG
jgi:RNA polymerase sigma factor (TIGR02999 family)